MMISSGENLGWVQKMMGHTTLKMITDKYFSYVPNMTHNDGSKIHGGVFECRRKMWPK